MASRTVEIQLSSVLPSTTGGRSCSFGNVMGIEIELIIAAADIVLALLLAVSLPAREEIS